MNSLSLLNNDKEKIKKTLNDLDLKKNNSTNAAKLIISEILELKNTLKININNIDENTFSKEILILNNKILNLNIEIKTKSNLLEKLEIPLLKGSECEHCRSVITEEHLQVC